MSGPERLLQAITSPTPLPPKSHNPHCNNTFPPFHHTSKQLVSNHSSYHIPCYSWFSWLRFSMLLSSVHLHLASQAWFKIASSRGSASHPFLFSIITWHSSWSVPKTLQLWHKFCKQPSHPFIRCEAQTSNGFSKLEVYQNVPLKFLFYIDDEPK